MLSPSLPALKKIYTERQNTYDRPACRGILRSWAPYSFWRIVCPMMLIFLVAIFISDNPDKMLLPAYYKCGIMVYFIRRY